MVLDDDLYGSSAFCCQLFCMRAQPLLVLPQFRRKLGSEVVGLEQLVNLDFATFVVGTGGSA
jgi:hypothetical protein